MTYWAVVLVLIAGAVACSNPLDLDTVCDASGCISISKFSAKIKSQLDGKVVGYVSTVGALAQTVEYGQARTSADPPSLSMKTTVPINVASISKVLTAIGVLQSLAAHNLTIDSKVCAYLPADWVKGPNVNTISFRDLLTHRAGFRNNGNGSNTTYAVIKQQIADGVKLVDKATASYNNLNFAIFRELLPFMEGFNDPGPAIAPRPRPASTSRTCASTSSSRWVSPVRTASPRRVAARRSPTHLRRSGTRRARMPVTGQTPAGVEVGY